MVASVGPNSNSLYFQAISAQAMLLREERHSLLWWKVCTVKASEGVNGDARQPFIVYILPVELSTLYTLLMK
jgi:hypothetical protein